MGECSQCNKNAESNLSNEFHVRRSLVLFELEHRVGRRNPGAEVKGVIFAVAAHRWHRGTPPDLGHQRVGHQKRVPLRRESMLWFLRSMIELATRFKGGRLSPATISAR